ncbi:hypothetical protein [Argonema galeatum]|uniref:hypothetical protein n=1 Tax=Argonema galeatum TaxID=2942762 RepID=UPI002010D971|nr:hypothetical protein [Argonema galeatum]MCL1465695.1 hypothetical protein [Argonema galeatum A003/A1]
MDSREVLQFVNEVMYAKTGKRLNNLQREVIMGILKKQKYADIAEAYGCSHGHAKDVGYELLQMFSEIFGEAIDKNNLKSVLERQGNLNISLGDRSINSNIDNTIVGCLNIGSDRPNPTPDTSQPATPDFQHNNNNQINQEKIDKLRQFGLSDEQIAEVLGLP